MNLRHIQIITIAALPLCAFSGNVAENDSIGNEKVTDLQEFVVKAENAYFKDGILTVIPTEKEKNSAISGNDLLRYLQIPTLVYDHNTDKINHMDGSLAIFINGEQTTEDEVRNLKADDVTRVEYMDFPSDPRFGHRPHVVNFVVRKYLYGGYTRIQTEEALTQFSNFSNVYSKFSIKDLTFDASAQFLGSNSTFSRDEAATTYRFKDENGKDAFLREETRLSHDIDKMNVIPVTLRIKYSKPTHIISNTIGYRFSGHPEKSSIYNTEYSGIYSDITSSSTTRRSHSNEVSWKGNYVFFLPRDWYLQIEPGLAHTHSNERRTSNSGIAGLDEILYANKENSYIANLSFNATKRFSKRHGVYLLASGAHAWYDINYNGTTPTQTDKKLLNMNYILGYYYNSGNFSAGFAGGYVYNRSSQEGFIRSESSPYLGINAYYTPNSKQSFSISASYNNSVPGASDTSSEIIQVNNFMYVTGDPDARETKNVNAFLSWSWIPMNMIRIGLTGSYFGNYGRLAPEYVPYANGTAILQKNGNNGDSHDFSLDLNFGLNNIANCLSITLRPILSYYSQTGTYAKNLLIFEYRANIDCLLGNGVSLFASIIGPRKYYSSGTLTRFSTSYSLGVRWRWRNLNVNLNLRNIFGGSDWGTKKFFESEYYSNSSLTALSVNYQANLTLTYTFSYGKKRIEHDEINGLNGAGSGAISF